MQHRARTRLTAARGRASNSVTGVGLGLEIWAPEKGGPVFWTSIAVDGHQYPRFPICPSFFVGLVGFSPALTLPLPLMLLRRLVKDVVVILEV
jgi:hypothetical protein